MGWVVRATQRPLDQRERDPALLYVYGSWVSEEEMHKSAASSDSLVGVAIAGSVSRGFQAINLLCFTNTKRNL